MDWTNPLLYLLGFTVLMAFGTGLWKIFWWVAKIDPLPDQFSKLAQEIREDVKRILLRLSPTTESNSPVRLNELGRKIADGLEVQRWAADLAPKLLAEVQGLREFEIDDFSYRYVHNQLDDKWSERIAASAYEHGVDRDGVRSVLWIVLRDELIRLVQLPPETTEEQS